MNTIKIHYQYFKYQRQNIDLSIFKMLDCLVNITWTLTYDAMNNKKTKHL